MAEAMIGVPRRLVALMVALLAPGWAMAAELQIVSEGPAVSGNARRFVVHSQSVGRDFVVDVIAPPSATDGRKAPAIYALDGGYGVALPIGQMLGGFGGMEPALLISVAAAKDASVVRLVDMLYAPATVAGKVTGGGGLAFEGFILGELRPFIEARFPADPARAILFGHSVGGLFAANLLAKSPQAFSGWLIASPSVWADPGVIEKLRAAKGTPEKQRVFVSVGGAEEPGMLQGAQAVADSLNGRFLVRGQAYAGEGHLTYYPMLVANAFPWLLPPVKKPAG